MAAVLSGGHLSASTRLSAVARGSVPLMCPVSNSTTARHPIGVLVSLRSFRESACANFDVIESGVCGGSPCVASVCVAAPRRRLSVCGARSNLRIMLLHATAFNAALLPCPKTLWNVPIDVPRSIPLQARRLPKLIDCPEGLDEACQEEWMSLNAPAIMRELNEVGALRFRGFSTSTKAGFRQWASSLPLTPCEDPLTSVGVRKLLSKNEGIYEAVNADELSKTFIGLHNDVTYKLAAPFAAFVCFEPAPRGGEFLLADGRAVLAELSPEVLTPLCERKVSVRVAALDLSAVLNGVNSRLQSPLRNLIEKVVRFALSLAVPLGLELAWGRDGGGDGVGANTLQILERPKAPINRHPESGKLTFFSSLHSQARYLQQRRAGGKAFSDTSRSSVAATDAFFGDDLSPIPPSHLEHIDEVITKCTVRVKMEPGDVVLLDSYQVLHGRDTFDGPREHGVLWLASAP